jgi:hypothetical protein
MEDEFYCILKLVSGEEIFSLISVDENDDDTIIILQNPLIMKMVSNQHGSFVKIKPWIEMSSDDMFIIKLDKVITMTESNDSMLIEMYNKFNSSDASEFYDPSGKVKVSSQMGYVASVEESRKFLENLYNGTKDTKEI